MKILIVKTSSLGDIIQSFPVLQYLRCHHPDAQIDWVVEKPFAELVKAHPYVNQVLTVETKKWRRTLFRKDTYHELRLFRHQLRIHEYHLVLDLQGNLKSGLITGLAKGSMKVGFGFKTLPEWPNFFFTHRHYNPPSNRNIREDYLFLVQSVFGHLKTEQRGIPLRISLEEEEKIKWILHSSYLQEGLKIMVCSGSNWQNKQLSVESLQQFLKLIQAKLKGKFLFVWGSPQEKAVAEQLRRDFSETSVVIDKLALPALQNLMAQVDLVVAMDSLPLHLAGTTSTPTYSVFGASLASKYKPTGLKHGVYQGVCPYGKVFEKRCPILRTCQTGSCIKEIRIDDLFLQFMSWWQTSTSFD